MTSSTVTTRNTTQRFVNYVFPKRCVVMYVQNVLENITDKTYVKPLPKISTIQVLRSSAQYMRYGVCQPIKKKKLFYCRYETYTCVYTNGH